MAPVAASDVFDGILARRFGGSRLGTVSHPVADKLCMAAVGLDAIWDYGRVPARRHTAH